MVALAHMRGSYSRGAPNVSTLSKWTGLRLDTDPYNLSSNMLLDACDIEITAAGSICTRRPIEPFIQSELTSQVCNVWSYEAKNGTTYLMLAQKDGTIKQVVDGPGAVTSSVFPVSTNGRCCWHSWQANGLLYVSDGDKTYCWNGIDPPKDVTTTAVHDNAKDETDSKVTNKGSLAACLATNWGEAVWLSDPKSDWGNDPKGIWFSGQLGKYDSIDGAFGGQLDYFTKQRLVAETDANADKPVALVPCGDKLLVYSHGSVHAISATGDDLSTFAIAEISRDFGASGPKAAGCQTSVSWFYDARRGPMAYTSEGAKLIGSPLGDLPARNLAPELTAVGFCDGKVMYSVAEKSAECNDTTYVFNPANETWTRWCVGFDCFYSYCPSKGRAYCLATTSKPCKSIVWLDGDQDNDELIDDYGCKQVEYYPYVHTSYQDGGIPSLEKRWTGFQAQIEMASKPVQLIVSAPVDWKPTSPSECFDLTPDQGDCFDVKDDCLTVGVKCYEVTSPGTAPVLVSTTRPKTSSYADSTVKTVDVTPCVSKSASMRIETGKGSGRWCLRQLFTYYYSKRLRS